MQNGYICVPVQKNIEKFSNPSANKTLVGRFFCGGLNYNSGMVGFRDNWQNQLGVSYTDVDGNNIEGTINILTKSLATSNPMIVDFTDENDVSQFKFFYGGHYDDFSGGRHALFNNSRTISQTSNGGNYSQIYRMYYYPQTITPTNPMPTPNGFTKYTVVEQGEVQFFNNSTEICVIDEGFFPPGTTMNGKKVIANGIPDGTVVGDYRFGPSKFGGKVPKTIYIRLSNTVDVLKSDGFFFIENAPPPIAVSNIVFSNITTNSFTVTWSGGDNATSYKFNLNSQAATPNILDDAIKSRTATFSNLNPGTAYNLAINAINVFGTITGNASTNTVAAQAVAGSSGPSLSGSSGPSLSGSSGPSLFGSGGPSVSGSPSLPGSGGLSGQTDTLMTPMNIGIAVGVVVLLMMFMFMGGGGSNRNND
jgi:hypothetical protein